MTPALIALGILLGVLWAQLKPLPPKPRRRRRHMSQRRPYAIVHLQTGSPTADPVHVRCNRQWMRSVKGVQVSINATTDADAVTCGDCRRLMAGDRKRSVEPAR